MFCAAAGRRTKDYLPRSRLNCSAWTPLAQTPVGSGVRNESCGPVESTGFSKAVASIHQPRRETTIHSMRPRCSTSRCSASVAALSWGTRKPVCPSPGTSAPHPRFRRSPASRTPSPPDTQYRPPRTATASPVDGIDGTGLPERCLPEEEHSQGVPLSGSALSGRKDLHYGRAREGLPDVRSSRGEIRPYCSKTKAVRRRPLDAIFSCLSAM